MLICPACHRQWDDNPVFEQLMQSLTVLITPVAPPPPRSPTPLPPLPLSPIIFPLTPTPQLRSLETLSLEDSHLSFSSPGVEMPDFAHNPQAFANYMNSSLKFLPLMDGRVVEESIQYMDRSLLTTLREMSTPPILHLHNYYDML